MKNTERKRVLIVPRPFDTEMEVREHLLACCSYAAGEGVIPVIDVKKYPEVICHMDAVGALYSAFYEDLDPLFACDEVWMFTQAVIREVRDIRYRAGLIGIPVVDRVRVNIPYVDEVEYILMPSAERASAAGRYVWKENR